MVLNLFLLIKRILFVLFLFSLNKITSFIVVTILNM